MDETSLPKRKGVLVVRDGWGRNPHPEHDAYNAVKQARTPRCDALLETYPHTLIHTSGEDVGLPDGTMGNSEVGHQNLGAGRIVDQTSVRITKAIRSGTFFENETLVAAVEDARDRGVALHVLGIASDAGVHGLLEHTYAVLELCRRLGHHEVFLHLITDGRDTPPFSGAGYVAEVERRCREIGVGRVVSVLGRYYAMDRDYRWQRVAFAHACLTGIHAYEMGVHYEPTAASAVESYYHHPRAESQQGDEFVPPTTVGHNVDDDPKRTRIESQDVVVFTNYRGDRPRELVKSLTMPEEQWLNVRPSPDTGQHGFDRGAHPPMPRVVTMTEYEPGLNVEVAFPKPPRMERIAGAYLDELGLRQFRCAETEKFAHVTYFFNDYREEPFAGERRAMPQSPQVPTYDLAPEMKATEVADAVVERLQAEDGEAFILVNFANGDMVGHTGDLDAAVRAIEAVDAAVGRVVDAAQRAGAAVIVTADHGNAEQMWQPPAKKGESGSPHTAHTTYDVECILLDENLRDAATGDPERPSERLRRDGRLADVMPTLLGMMGLEKPAEMSGATLLQAPGSA